MKCHPFLQELNKKLSSHKAVNHPLLGKLDELDEKGLKKFACQFYKYVEMFPRLMGAVVYNVPDEKARLPLVINLMNEHGDLERMEKMDSSHAHPELYRRFTRAIGISDEELFDTKTEDYTKDFIDKYKKLYLEDHFLSTMGAVGPGTECAVPEMYVPMLDSLKRKGLSEEDLYFFSLHLPVDTEHCEMICEGLESYLEDEGDREKIEKGAIEAMEAREKFWNELERDMSSS